MTLRLEDIRWEGLFPRRSGEHDFSRFEAFHQDRKVLVTGAGGSIGAALARAVLHLRPSALILLDSSEQNLYYIDRELSRAAAKPEVVPVIGSVADRRCIADVFARLRPTIIYHAAALKHVPLGEQNPFAVVENNVFGTSVLANEAAQRGVERLIVISTDKSVNPQSIMGATKRLAETIVSTMSGPHTRMTSIRLGNVLGSEGSVVPLFLEQIARGEPVTVTDPEVERYFLPMDETVLRILSATVDCPEQPATAVPIMEKPVKIVDLARLLIEQASVGSVEITFTGLRPGDKLHEEFIANNESILPLTSDGLQWVQSPAVSNSDLARGLARLARALIERDLPGLLDALALLVPEYQPSNYLRKQVAAMEER